MAALERILPIEKEATKAKPTLNASRSKAIIEKTNTSELVIALCGPIGSPLHEVAETIKNRIQSVFGYQECEIIKLSSLINKYAEKVKLEVIEDKGYERIKSQIDVGNKLREMYTPSILAELAIAEISKKRKRLEKENNRNNKLCTIIDSIKNQNELDILRMVYREMVYVIGVFHPISGREKNLTDKGISKTKALELIEIDSGDNSLIGQTVKETFPQCDLFLRIEPGAASQIDARVERFLHLVFGTKIITPTHGEFAMYMAGSAAANSACLSRQVGASLLSKDNEIISTGWNDVPKFGGGLYANDNYEMPQDKDHRCWNSKKCFNDEEKELFANLLISEIKAYVKDDMLSELSSAIKKFGGLRGIIEFSRSIHAEMHAILNAGKLAGHKILNSKLYVTTYPCHSCARHIVAAGISEVYYIEPFVKSKALKLHSDSITDDESVGGKVKLLTFDGVAPWRFLDFFKALPDSRKINGRSIIRVEKDAQPKLKKSLEAIPQLEGLVVKSLISNNIITLTPGEDNE